MNRETIEIDESFIEPFVDITSSELMRIAEAHKTPTFVYSDTFFAAKTAQFVNNWGKAFKNTRIYLSYKTNYLPMLCNTAHKLSLGADVVSGYELSHAFRNCPHGPIVFNGPLKRRHELAEAAKADVMINIDLAEEIDILSELRSSGEIATAKLGLRVNPGEPVFDAPDSSFVETHGFRQRTSKFGWPTDDGQALAMAKKIQEAGFIVSAIHAHLNSQITNTGLLLKALTKVLDFAVELRAEGFPLEEINVGGGFGVSGMCREKTGWWSALKVHMGEAIPNEPDASFDMTSFTDDLNNILKSRNLQDLMISCEPGRYLMSESMALLTCVVGVKHLPERTWLIIDGGLNILPTAAFGETRRLRFFRGDQELVVKEDDPICAIGGPLCYEGDIIMAQARIPKNLKSGDLVLLSDAGAYTISRSTNFNQSRAAVVARDGGAGQLVWRRETYDDIFSYAV